MVGPDYVPPDTQMPDRWTQELSEGLTEGKADLRTWWTVLSFTAFLAIVWWAYSGKRKAGFDAAARLAVDDDAGPAAAGPDNSHRPAKNHRESTT